MFYSPKNRDELIKLLGENLDNTYLIAGGTDLIIHLQNNKITDYSIIDLTKVDEFGHVREDEGHIYIGSICTMTEICENETIKKSFKSLYQSAYELGSELIRNKATIGGNIANASQSADVVLSLFSYDAKVKVLNSKNEEKLIPISEVVIGKNKTSLKEDEVISEIIIEKKNAISVFRKVGSRKAVTISKICCSTVMELENNIVLNVSIFLGAVGVKPTEAKLLQNVFLGKNINDISVEDLQNSAFDEIEEAIPDRSSKYYKRIAVQGLIEDVYGDLINHEKL